MKRNLRDLTKGELNDWILSIGEKKFRTQQIHEWLWKKNVMSFSEMKNLSKELLKKMENEFDFPKTKIETELQSVDKTVKFIFKLYDGALIEGVLIFHGSRSTACISSQVGCPLKCQFCATGEMGLIRNLHHWEIVDQYALINQKSLEYFQFPIGNIVMMGMGEPLLNFNNVVRALKMLTSEEGNALSPYRITLSTVGIADKIAEFAHEFPKIQLALSLHAANDILRSKIMPVNNKYNIKTLISAIKEYHQTTGERITIEYVLLHRVNDSLKDAEELALFCRNFPVKVNIIQYNTTTTLFSKSDAERKRDFVQYLESKNMIVNIRHSKGDDIAAACGQLIKQEQNRQH